MVEQLTAAGLNADAVAQIINVNKNTLRAEHALALANGRATLKKKKVEQKASALTRQEQHAADAILATFSDGNWIMPDGRCALFPGTDGQGARTAADAFAKWVADGGRWITTGLNHNFSPEQLREFAALKAEAAKLRA
jgi:hypothetical protein